MFVALALLTAIWVAMTGELTLGNFAIGVAFGFAALSFSGQRISFSLRALTRLPQAASLLLFFLKELRNSICCLLAGNTP